MKNILSQNGRLKLIGTEFSASKDCIPSDKTFRITLPFYETIHVWIGDETRQHCYITLVVYLIPGKDLVWILFLTPFQTYALNWGKYSIRGSNESYKRAIKEKNYVLFFLHVSLPLVAFSGNTARGNDFLSKRNIFLEPSLLLLFVSDTKEMAKFDFRGVWFVLCIIKGSYFTDCKYNSL